jgi:hypothetical protein
MRPPVPPAWLSVTVLSLPTRVYSDKGGLPVLYLVLILVVATVVYMGVRSNRSRVHRPSTREIGPDDDPEFLWKLGGDEKHPR